MDAFLGKKYKLASNVNFDEFMKALGVGIILRKIGNTIYPTIQLNKEGNEYVFTSTSTFKNIMIRFVPGVTFNKISPDGRDVKSTIIFEGTTMIENEVEPQGRVITYTSTFTETNVTMRCVIGEIECIRNYNAI